LPFPEWMISAPLSLTYYPTKMEQLTKPGYKQTELGWIPEDWEVKTIGEICSPSKVKFNPLFSENRKCVELEDLSQGTGRLLSISNSSNKMSLKTVFLKGESLLGKLRPYLRKYLFAEFDGVCSTEIWVLKSKLGIDPKFLFYQVQSDKIIEAANLSTGTKMPRAEWNTVSETEIFSPENIIEQTAIATALSDMDRYIHSLEALIAKKRLIKQGAMQELLTPKEDWEVRKLGIWLQFQREVKTRRIKLKMGCSNFLLDPKQLKGLILIHSRERLYLQPEMV